MTMVDSRTDVAVSLPSLVKLLLEDELSSTVSEILMSFAKNIGFDVISIAGDKNCLFSSTKSVSATSCLFVGIQSYRGIWILVSVYQTLYLVTSFYGESAS